MVVIENGKILITVSFLDKVAASNNLFDPAKVSSKDTYIISKGNGVFIFLFNCRCILSARDPTLKVIKARILEYTLPHFSDEDMNEMDHHIYITLKKGSKYEMIFDEYNGKPCRLFFNIEKDNINLAR